MKTSVQAEVGAEFAPFVRTNLKRAADRIVAWASRPSILAERSSNAKSGSSRKRRGRRPKPLSLGELWVILVGDQRMSGLHEQFMGIPSPTDVLTFPLDADAAGNITAGEIYVCVPEARRRAKSRGIDPKREVLLYALHGMLHLLGYDDRTRGDYRIMHRTEDLILTELGLGPVFAPPARRKHSTGATRMTAKKGAKPR